VTGASYRIADEPTPGRLAGWTVNPFWPLLGTMLGGCWLGLPWFAFNAAAMGSATRRREWAWLIGGLLVSAALGGGLLFAAGAHLLPARAFRYAVVGLTAWRLLVAYLVFSLQQASFELHQHFGGPSRNGALLVVAGALQPAAWLLGKEGVVLLALLVG
jgi:hypothetical protein